MKTNNTPKLAAYLRARIRFTLNPLWFTDPIKARRQRPKILGPESDYERAANDVAIRVWRERQR